MDRTTVSRREACRHLATGTAALALSAVPVAAPARAPFALSYVLASSMYGKFRLEQIVPQVRKIGAAHIDLWPLGHADQREQMEAMGHEAFAALLRRHEVKLGMITRYDLGPFGLREEIRTVGKLGGKLLISGSRGPRDTSGDELRRAVKRFVEQMAPHVAVAEEEGVKIGIENHGHALIASADSIRYFAEFARSANLGIALAPYHLPQDPSLLATLIDELGPKLVHFYAWQYGQGCMKKLPKARELEQMPGRGKLDFAPLLAALAKIDYQGWTEIFMHPVPRGIPIRNTAAAVTEEINRARGYLENCLRKS